MNYLEDFEMVRLQLRGASLLDVVNDRLDDDALQLIAALFAQISARGHLPLGPFRLEEILDDAENCNRRNTSGSPAVVVTPRPVGPHVDHQHSDINSGLALDVMSIRRPGYPRPARAHARYHLCLAGDRPIYQRAGDRSEHEQ